VHTVHGWGHTPSDPAWRRWLFIELERAAAKRSDALIAVSEDNRDEGMRLGIGTDRLYHVIPAVVDLEPRDLDFPRARADARRRLGVSPDAEVVGWVGRFVDQKDPETLGAVLGGLLRSRDRTVAVLVGNGPRRGIIEKSLRLAGVEDRVVFTGILRDARSVMPAFDVLVHPSLWEGQPLVVQEALAARVPVVAARASGVRELITDGETGFVVAPQSPDDMLDAVVRVLEAPALQTPLSAENLRPSYQRGPQEAVERHRRLYHTLLAEPQRG
jgi:glycosyltransferase involved in cell wall biosynthesis